MPSTLRPSLFVGALIAAVCVATPASAEALTKVFINGAPTPVHFNDGDSFRIQTGPHKGKQARLSGYNTLESFGPVHSWGTWTEHELFAVAKLATKTAQKGVWHCEGDGSTDTYGRLLLFCRDLAAHLIQNGLAHAYSVDEKPADAELLAVQKIAMQTRKGIWSHGIPTYVMTSLHSKDEGGGNDGVTSNRLISTKDGHSDKWVHNDNYSECQKVCHELPATTDADVPALLKLLQQDPEAKDVAATLTEQDLRQVLLALSAGGTTFITSDGVSGAQMPKAVTDEALSHLVMGLNAISDAGKMPKSGKRNDSCQVYVDFRRRFGAERATCLR